MSPGGRSVVAIDAVEVGAAEGEQAEALRQRGQLGDELRLVALVVRLEAERACRRQLRGDARVVVRERGVGEDGDAARVADHRDRLGGGEFRALRVGGAVAPDEALECLVEALDVPGFEQRLRDVRPADRGLAREFLHPRPLDRHAQPFEGVDAALRPVDAAPPELVELLDQLRALAVDEVAEDVHLGAGHVAGQLDAGHEREAGWRAAAASASARPSRLS